MNDYYFSFDDLVTARLVSAVRQCVLALVIFSYRLVYCRCKIHGLARCFIKCVESTVTSDQYMYCSVYFGVS